MKSLVVVLFVEVSFEHSFEGMGGLNVADVRRERIPFLWSTVGQTALPNVFCSIMEYTKYRVTPPNGTHKHTYNFYMFSANYFIFGAH